MAFKDIDNVSTDATLDLHLGTYHFFDEDRYSHDDSIKYFLEIIYWACAYGSKAYPEEIAKGLLQFDWFDRQKMTIELVHENRSTSVFVKDTKKDLRVEIDGWTMKH